MSVVEAMSIMGIRAFSPEDQHVIQFQHPLTLLVGPNGAGKTTIIECLKYATTGEHPLNTKGGAFVHDPKLARESEVRAQVRLHCRNLQGHSIQVVRSLQATQKAKSIQFKTLDGVITKERNGETVSITSKCAELNREMVSTLGVSKAVLDNVIFCHQEEANWPLSEGKSVKQKFDDIFAATRYIKALEEIRKIQKNQKISIMKENTALEFLESNSKKAEELEKVKQDTERKLQDTRHAVERAKEQLVPIERKMRELSKEQSEIVRLDGQLGAVRSRKEQMLEDRDKLRKRIKQEFLGSDEQLQHVIDEQDSYLKLKEKRLQDSERKVQPLKRDIESLTKKKNDLSITQGKLQQEVDSADTKRKARDNLARQYNKKYQLKVAELPDEELSDDQVDIFESAFKLYVDEESANMRAQKKRFDAEVRQADEEYKSAWQEKTELVEGCKHKQKAMEELKEKHAAITKNLRKLQIASDSGQLDVLQQRLDSAKEELIMTETTSNVDELRDDIGKLNARISGMQTKMDRLESEICEMQKYTESRTKIEMLCKERANKETTVEQLRQKHRRTLAGFGLASDDSFPDKLTLTRWSETKEQDVQTAQRKLDDERKQLTQLTTERDLINREIQNKKERHDQLDDELFELCGSQDLEIDLATLEDEIGDLRDNKGLTDGIQFMYKKFIKELRAEGHMDKSDVPCPLCQRLFEETSEIDELVSSLQRKVDLAPRKLENQKKDLESKEVRHKILLKSRPKKAELDMLSRKIPELRHDATKLSDKISSVTSSKDELEKELNKLKEEESKAKHCLPDVAQIESLTLGIRDLNREIRLHESRAPVTSRNSLDDLNAEKKELSDKSKRASQEIERKRREIDAQTTAVNNMKEKVNAIQEKKLQLTSDLQKCEQLKEQEKGLAADIERIKSDIKENQKLLTPLEGKVAKLEKQKNSISRRNDETHNKSARRVQSIEGELEDFRVRTENRRQFAKSGTKTRLQRTTKQIEETADKFEKSQKKEEQLREEITRIQKELATCTERQRDLEDNSSLRDRQKEIVKVEEEAAQIESKLDGMNAEKLEREKRKLNEEWQSLNNEKERSRTKQEMLKDKMIETKRELNKDEYKYADKRFRETLINVTTLELASEDLGKYYKALDRAIMRFHQIKMDEINKIIKDLWQQTYRGKDIDYIQIRSDEDTGSSASTRRTFNYRVVMRTGDTEMDMRGRCSAGQKVLASLVIRLALAETFCINCGILALDEPTTNLDRDNIESLAQALISIIDSRAQQRNFQLMVITHDEDFVEVLGRAHYADYFFRVEKDARGKSKIIRCEMRDLCK